MSMSYILYQISWILPQIMCFVHGLFCSTCHNDSLYYFTEMLTLYPWEMLSLQCLLGSLFLLFLDLWQMNWIQLLTKWLMKVFFQDPDSLNILKSFPQVKVMVLFCWVGKTFFHELFCLPFMGKMGGSTETGHDSRNQGNLPKMNPLNILLQMP